MGQKLDKAPRGAYDAIVYIDGSEVVAEDSNGRKTASGVAGTSDGSIINFALSRYQDVFLYPSPYFIETPLLVKSNQSLRSLSGNRSYLKPVGAINVIESSTPSSPITDVFLENLAIGNIDNASLVGNDGIHILLGNRIYVKNCLLRRNAQNGAYFGQPGSYRINFENCSIDYNGNYGIYLNDIDSYSFVDHCVFQDNVSYDIYSSNSNLIDIHRCDFENTIHGGIFLSGSYNCVRNCYINSIYRACHCYGEENNLADNVISGQSYDAVRLENASKSMMFGNDVRSTSGNPNVIVNGNSAEVLISDNQFLFSSISMAIQLGGTASNISILNNHLNSQTIDLASHTGNTIKNNLGLSNILNLVASNTIVGNGTFLTENFGSSTGTGSEQTIAHGLAAIPTGCKAWIKYLVNGRYITEMIPFDATNVYPTVASGVAYEWRIE